MSNRRTFLRRATAATALAALPVSWPATIFAKEALPRRRIPGTETFLPVIGLGNSNAFRQGDVAASTELLKLFAGQGGSYVDCAGDSRFLVAEVARTLGLQQDLFLGTYFSGEEAGMRSEADRLLQITGKKQLDLMQAYTEFARPNWSLFEKWKEEGRTRYIGTARHRPSYYEAMISMMATGTVDVLQVNYSPLETEADERVLPMALDKGVAVTINRPFINGEFFTLVRGHPLPGWAEEFDCASWAQFSLKFILSHPAVTCVLTETANPKHALDNIGAGFGRLPDEPTRQKMVKYLKNL